MNSASNSSRSSSPRSAANTSANPILLRTSATAGHGMGNSLDETIAERTDIYAFLIHELGVEFKPVRSAALALACADPAPHKRKGRARHGKLARRDHRRADRHI